MQCWWQVARAAKDVERIQEKALHLKSDEAGASAGAAAGASARASATARACSPLTGSERSGLPQPEMKVMLVSNAASEGRASCLELRARCPRGGYGGSRGTS